MQSLSLKGAVLVTLPNEVSIIDVKKSLVMFQELSVPIFGLIENMSYYEDPLLKQKHYIFGKDAGAYFAKEAKIPFLGALPIEKEVAKNLDRGNSIFSSPIMTPFIDQIQQIAVELCSQLCDYNKELNGNFSYKEISQNKFELINGERSKILHALSVQSTCPCARCVDEESGKRVINSQDTNLKIASIEKVGAFGLKFRFSSGCSKGIYPWKYLWQG